MSAFSDLRQSLIDDLPDLAVSPAWPEVLSPPCAFIAPPLAETYVQRGPNFGQFTIALDLYLLTPHADPADSLTQLEAMLSYALVNTADWTLVAVDAPAPTVVTESGAEYLATIVHLSKPVRIGV
jgi:hypothetical protein